MSRLIEAPRKQIVVHDTTLRDGNQDGRSELSVAGKLVVIQALDAFGVDYIEAGWPDSNANDKVLFQEAKSLRLRHAKLIAFGRTAKAGVSPENDEVLDALLNAGTSIVALVGKADTLNVTEGLRIPLEENLRMIQRSTEHLRKEGRRVTFDAEHFFDGFERDPEYSLKTLEAAIAGGAEVVTLCDTNGRMHYTDVRKVTEAVRQRFPNIPLGIHVHNNKGLALPATLEAIEAGATQVQGVVNGTGEWAGNVDLVQVVGHLHSDRYNMQTNVDLTKTPQVTRVVAEESGIPVPANQPFSGAQVWTRNAALHAVSWLREPKTYWYDDAEKYGREDEVGFSDQGGGANVLWWAEKLGFTLSSNDEAYQKIFDEMKKKRPWGKAQIFLLYYREIMGGSEPFEILESQVVDVRDKSSQATVKVRVNGDVREEYAESDEGLINAFDLALRKALSHKHPEVIGVALVPGGYKNTSKGGRDTSATVTVEFQLTADGKFWNTKVSGANQQRAGEDALVDGYKYYILTIPNLDPRP